jgi:hypothetical protein
MQETFIDVPEKELQRKGKGKGQPRIQRANRQQIEMRIAALDSLVPEDHKVRIIWEMAQEYDLSKNEYPKCMIIGKLRLSCKEHHPGWLPD